MDIVGYNEVDGKRFAILSGPCRGCGATNYGISSSGPEWCGACALGRPPEVTRLRAELSASRNRVIDFCCALEVALGIGCATPEMQKTGERLIDEFKRTHPRVAK